MSWRTIGWTAAISLVAVAIAYRVPAVRNAIYGGSA